MAVVAFLSDPHLAVEPGAEAVCEIHLRNSSQVVDQFSLELVGGTDGWATIEPPIVNLLPDMEATARVVFRPPRAPEVQAGTVDYGVRVASREDPLGSVVEEGDLQIAPFTDVVAELVPQKARGKRRAKYRLAVDNRGNHDTPVAITAADPDDALDIVVETPAVVTKPGTATLIKAKVAPHKRFLRGEPQVHGFQLTTMAEGHEPVTSDGVMIQEQLMPKWLLPFAAMLAAAAVLLIGVWFALLRPSVQSMATDAAQTEAIKAVDAAQKSQASQASSGGSQSGGSGQSGGGSASGQGGGSKTSSSAPAAKKSTAPTNKTVKQPATVVTSTGPTSAVFRIATAANPVTDGTFQQFSYVQPNHQALDISDIIMQNPRGDSGFLQIMIGTKVVLVEGLDNFRDLDQPFIVPLHVVPDQPVIVAVNCTKPGSTVSQCTPSASFSARISK